MRSTGGGGPERVRGDVKLEYSAVPMEHSSDLRAKDKVLTVPDCTLSPLSPKDESEPVGDPVVSDPMYPRGIHLSCDRPLTLLGTNRRSCPPRAYLFSVRRLRGFRQVVQHVSEHVAIGIN